MAVALWLNSATSAAANMQTVSNWGNPAFAAVVAAKTVFAFRLDRKLL